MYQPHIELQLIEQRRQAFESRADHHRLVRVTQRCSNHGGPLGPTNSAHRLRVIDSLTH